MTSSARYYLAYFARTGEFSIATNTNGFFCHSPLGPLLVFCPFCLSPSVLAYYLQCKEKICNLLLRGSGIRGVPRNFVRGGGGSTFSIEDREKGDLVGTRHFISYNKIFLMFGIVRLFMMTTNLFVIANVKQSRT